MSQHLPVARLPQATEKDFVFYFMHFNNNYRDTFTQANNYTEECRIYILITITNGLIFVYN